MGASERLQVRVNDELALDAGACEDQGAWARAAHPSADDHAFQPMVGREGIAAAVVTLRWGSYLSVLLDRDKPVWPGVASPSTSHAAGRSRAA